jgi:hypothetical protein
MGAMPGIDLAFLGLSRLHHFLMEGHMRLTRRHLLAAGAALLAGRAAGAQSAWPTRSVRLISSSPPAGASDILTRTLGQALQEQTGQSFVIENKAGAAGVIGSDFVAKAAPDGYTWLTANVGPQAINQTLAAASALRLAQGLSLRDHHRPAADRDAGQQRRAGEDAAGVRRARLEPSPVASISAAAATARFSPHRRAVEDRGRHQHAARALSRRAGATQDLMGGRLEAMFDSLPSAAPHIRSGTVRALAVSTPQRSPSFPEIPTIAEQGYPSVVTTNWFAFAGPAGVPDDIIARMHAECARALKSPP